MKRLKYEILFVILFMTVGIAAVSTNLLINGSTPIAGNTDDFNVYFSNVLVDGEQDLSLIRNDTSLYFEFEFDTLGETKFITYDVTNASKNYDADIEISCTESTPYITIANEFDVTSYMGARSTRTGVLTLTMKRSITGQNKKTGFRCTINSSAVERTSHGVSDIPVPAIRTFKIGEEVIIGSEKFNVISDNGNTVSMLTQQNIGVDFKQSSDINSVVFADTGGWEYTPGPKEIDIQQYDGDVKTLINGYVDYLRETFNIDSIRGDLISLMELSNLGCVIDSAYSNQTVSNCDDSSYTWLYFEEEWWTKSAVEDYSYSVWTVFGSSIGTSEGVAVVRPVITISKAYFDSKIIEFTIEGTKYYAEEGMYWSDWVNSEYNTGGYVIYQDDNNFRVVLPSSIYHVNDDPGCDTIIFKDKHYIATYVSPIF